VDMSFEASSERATRCLPFFSGRGERSSMKDAREHVDLSIVVVSYNAREALQVCLRSIDSCPPRGTFEVLVVDNASTDGSSEMVKRLFPGARLLALAANHGYAYACNYGARSARGGALLFLNSDVEVTAGALGSLQTRLERREGAAICSGRLESYDGSPQPSCRRFPTHLSILFGRGSVLSRLPLIGGLRNRYIVEPPQGTGVVDSVAGACILVQREVFESLGGFDERFFMYAEDLDLCYRLKKRGGQVLYVPESVFKHRWGASSVGNRLGLELEHHRSIYRYFTKHYPRKWLSNLILAAMLLLQLGSLFFIRFLNLKGAGEKTRS
jgi:N-acetylglucosaminyl-diphospho-decaprenol L-rhamnosyltransferase